MRSRLSLSRSLLLSLHALLLLAAAILLALHAVHLAADFPNHSPWMDWSKYTDEGWYGDAAIRRFQLGHWYVPGDFNPAAALPVWPLLEAALFRFTGVSLTAARALTVAVFAGILISSWFLLHRWRATLAASAAVLLLAASPFVFNFTRLAILEPMLILVALIALLAASAARPGLPSRSSRSTAVIVLLGILLPALILTKTTGLFLVPGVAWLLFAAVGFEPRSFLRIGLPAAALAACLWLAWYLLLVRPHLLTDYRYLFAANAYTGITPANALQVLSDTFRDGFWMGFTIYPAAMAAVFTGIFSCWTSLQRLRARPLVTALLLWAGGYFAFLAYHDNLQPRYYLVIAVPLTLLLPLVIQQVILERLPARLSARPLRLTLAAAAAILLLSITIPDTRATLSYIRHPEYTLLDAARDIKAYIADDQLKHPQHNPLVLSISGSDLSLMTGLPSICDDFGTLELADRVKKYRPGWYVAWNQIDDDKMDAMTPLFHIERVAAFPAMDDPDRNLLILYRLDASLPTPPPRRKKSPMPTRLQTKVGQQPSVEQLEH